MEKHRILIADDNEINRILISSMLEERYELLQAVNGAEVISLIQSYHGDIDLILLDLIMPVMDGIEVLKEMNRQDWIKDIPVIVISAETSTDLTRKAYELGTEDYICRPFDPETVARRIQKAMLLHSERKTLIDALTESFNQRERQNEVMINMLSSIVEQRNGESGQHVIHINIITGLILKELKQITDKYDISDDDIAVICNASSFHDIGKMGIPEYILNKPGKLTPAEFEIMKTHSMLGYEMVCKVDELDDEPLLKYIKSICRWHHERWDGRGYPDGLSGDDIPIEAQAVSIADVYDALTSERCYKKAFTPEKTMEMILGGECGTFNPLILECLKNIESVLKTLVETDNSIETINKEKMDFLSVQAINRISELKGTDVSRNIRLLRTAEERHSAFKRLTDEAWFEYYTKPEMITFNPAAVNLLGLPEKIVNPFKNPQFLEKCGLQLKYAFELDAEEQQENREFDMTIRFADNKNYHIKGVMFVSDSGSDNFERYISGGLGKIICVD